jgi:hypothetical protein
MNTSDIILAIDAEIAQLQKVKALLTGTDVTTKRKPGCQLRPIRQLDSIQWNSRRKLSDAP